MEYAHSLGPHVHWAWITPILFLILVFFFVSFMIRRAGGCRRLCLQRTRWAPFGGCKWRQGPMWWVETPLQILERRYASGEITNEEYERIKRDIDSHRES